MRKLWLLVLGSHFLGVASASADEALAKHHFEQGLAASKERRWDEAVDKLEASLAEHEKPATRYNLVLAYGRLRRELDVIRHGTAFLRQHTDGERSEARVRIEQFVSAAVAQVAVLDLSSLPPSASVTIDGSAPEVVDGPLVYVAPGEHVLEARVAPDAQETVQMTLAAGHRSSWPRPLPNPQVPQIASAPSAAPPMAHAPLPAVPSAAAPSEIHPAEIGWSRPLAWVLGVGGAALFIAGVACLWIAEERAHELAHGGVAGTTMPGYLTSVERYRDARRAVAPVALSAGFAMSAATVLSTRLPSRRARVWSIMSTVLGVGFLGVGSYFLGREPVPVVPFSNLDRPSRQWGVVLAALGFPFLSFGVSSMLRERRGVSLAGHSEGLRVTW